MKFRKISLLLCCLLFAVVMPITASAKEWAAEDFTVEVPEELYIFTEETPLDSLSWTLAGVGDPNTVRKLFGEPKSSSGGIFGIFGGSQQSEAMNAIANFIGPGGDVNILVTKKQSADSYRIYNFADVSKEEQQAFLDNLISKNEDSEESESSVEADVSFYEEGDVLFFELTISGTVQESIEGQGLVSKDIHEVLYGTILNGYTVSINTYRLGEKISEETMAAIRSIVNSFKVTKVIDPSETAMSKTEIFRVLLILGAFILMIAGSVTYMRVSSSKEKKQKKVMAERLSEYHKRQKEENEQERKVRFVNKTECTNEVVRKFSIYQAYIKTMAPNLIGALASVFILIFTFSFAAEWWMNLVAVGLAGYYVYKMMTSVTAVERVQRRIFSQGNTKIARYSFYEDVFRISGVQSASNYPYFQITDVRITKDYFYLYYGLENAYIVAKSGFELGTDAEFEQFIKEKRRENKI
jgi:hypothetical protein